MSDYYVHWNTIVKRIRIHQSSCGACNNGEGMHQGKIAAGRSVTYDWEAAETYEEAKAIVVALKKSKPILKKFSQIDCGLCRPGRNR